MLLVLLISCYSFINQPIKNTISSILSNPVITLFSIIIILIIGYFNLVIGILLLLLLFISIYNFGVLLKTGFVGDDAYNSMIKGAIINQNISLNDRILSEIKGWTFGAGRIMIVNWYVI